MTAPEDETRIEDPAAAGLSQNKADGLSPGEILREGRLAHQYSIEDLCAQTKLTPKTVAALEDNDFKALSQPVFARGYYRQCAKVLDIDSERISRAYSAWAGEPEKISSDSVSSFNMIPQDVTPGGSRIGRLLLILVIVVVAVAVALYLLAGGATNDTNGDLSDTGAETTTAISAEDNADGPGSDQSVSDDAGQSNGTGDEISAGGTPDIAGGDTARTGQTAGGRNVNRSLGITPPDEGQNESGQDGHPAQNAAAANTGVPANRLTLTFEKRSWVRVTDANGNRLASGIFEAGQSKEFDASAPYQVRLGFAPGVKVAIGGKTVDVAAQTNGSSVATLTVAAPGDDTPSSDQ